MIGRTAIDTIDSISQKLMEISLKIWTNPEGAFKEYKACKLTSDILKKYGFKVEMGIAGIPTAIKATWGNGKPVIGLLGEYDAMPSMSQKVSIIKEPVIKGGYGHCCGHNLLCAATVGGCLGMQAEMIEKNLSGTIVFYGCPAEEVLTGKVFMAREGAFDGIDLALAYHPGRINDVNIGINTALNSVKFHFKGIAAHAGAYPENGRSALDAVELTNVGANYLREHIQTDVRMHYIITDGGMAPNIVPDHASVWYYIRAPKRETVEEVYTRLLKVAKGAAMMTETELEVEFMGGCYNTLSNKILAGVVHEAMNEVHMEPWNDEEIAFAKELNRTSPEQIMSFQKKYGLPESAEIFYGTLPIANEDSGGSTDVGDVCHIVPTASFRTACYNLGASGHSWQITACSAHSIGQKGMLNAAKIMAVAGIKIFSNPATVQMAKEEFERETCGKYYVCPIPPDAEIPK